MRPVLFHIGTLAIPSFWTMAFLGFLAAFLVLRAGLIRRGHDERLAYDIMLCAYVGGWVGARLLVIPTGWQYFKENPIAFLLSGSGWVWYGGLIGGALATLTWGWRNRFSLLELVDLAAPGLAIGQGIGRIGCQLSGDGDYGIATTLPWGMSYPDGVVPTTEIVHPTPVYEAVGCFLIFAWLWRRGGKSFAPGTQMARYLLAGGLLRFAVEFVRRNPAWLVGMTTAQWNSLGLIAIGLFLLRWAARAVAAEP